MASLPPVPLTLSTLYLYLRTCDRPTRIAGLNRGAASICDDTGWSFEGVREGLRALSSKGLLTPSERPAYVLVHEALDFDTPAPGNDHIGALAELNELPDCAPVRMARIRLETGSWEGFGRAAEGLPGGLAEGLPSQEQEQEPDQEQQATRARAHRPQQRRGPDPSLRSSTAWESITPTGAAPVARDIEGIATSIWRRTLSLSDAMHLERRGKSGEDFIPPPGQLDPITALVLVNDDATLDAAVKRAQGADKPRAFLMAMADENGRISLRAPSHAAAEQSALVPRPAVDAEKWWRFTEGLRCVVGDFVDCGRCASDLDSVVDLAGSLAPEFGVVLPPDDAIRPVIGAWLAKRAAS